MTRALLASVVLAMYLPFCGTQEMRPTTHPPGPRVSLWTAAADLPPRDMYFGPWGSDRAPDPFAVYTLVERKHTGVNPGMTVRDERGRTWVIKQSASTMPDEGPVEVVVSRVLSAVGYHQPPIYYMPSFTLKDDWGTHTEPGGRFALIEPSLKLRGTWSLQQNPFVGTDPYEGLLVMLLMFNSSDLKNSNNSIFEYRYEDSVEYWYVVRDLGTALGDTGKFAPAKNDARAFAHHGFMTGISDGFVQFAYKGFHRELFEDRITPDRVVWAAELLGTLSDREWIEAFLAGGYSPAQAAPFIDVLQRKIAEGRALAETIAAEERDE
jgi:hypothetical protein